MLVVAVPKRNRVRARARRPIDTVPRPERTEAERPLPRMRSRSAVPGPVRATDAASPVLERAAAAERTYVMRDVRRLGLVAAVMLLLLVASGFGVEQLF